MKKATAKAMAFFMVHMFPSAYFLFVWLKLSIKKLIDANKILASII